MSSFVPVKVTGVVYTDKHKITDLSEFYPGLRVVTYVDPDGKFLKPGEVADLVMRVEVGSDTAFRARVAVGVGPDELPKVRIRDVWPKPR